MSKSLLPIVLLTGFLGAGKTTFARHFLREAKARDLKVGVIVNEWGIADIDSSLLQQAGADLLGELAGGCACCSSQDEMIWTLLELGQKPREEQPDLVLLELSGLADPLVTLDGLTVAALLPVARVVSMVSVVDAPRLPQLRRDDGTLRPLLVRQIALADTVIINKSDLAFRGEDAALRKKHAVDTVRDFNLFGTIHFARGGEIDLEGIWNRAQSGAALDAPRAGRAAHGQTQTVVVPVLKPIALEKLEAAFATLDESVWRAKGFVRVAGENDLFLAQFVGLGVPNWSLDRFEPRYLSQLPASELVFIGPNLNRDLLFQSFAGSAPLL